MGRDAVSVWGFGAMIEVLLSRDVMNVILRKLCTGCASYDLSAQFYGANGTNRQVEINRMEFG